MNVLDGSMNGKSLALEFSGCDDDFEELEEEEEDKRKIIDSENHN